MSASMPLALVSMVRKRNRNRDVRSLIPAVIAVIVCRSAGDRLPDTALGLSDPGVSSYLGSAQTRRLPESFELILLGDGPSG